MKVYRVVLSFIKPIVAGVPADPDALKGKIAKELKKSGVWTKVSLELGKKDKASVVDILFDYNYEEIKKAIEKYPGDILKQLRVFRRDKDGCLILKSYQIKAFIRETAKDVLKLTSKEVESIKHGVNVYPEQIRLYRDKELKNPIKEPEGLFKYNIHVVGMKGPRSSINFFEIVNPPAYIGFYVLVATDAKNREVISENVLRKIFEEGGLTNGIGSNRPMGFGNFVLESLEKVSVEEIKEFL
jgi:hypothetical protein